MVNNSYKDLSRKEEDIIRSANILTEFQTTGVIKFRSISKTYNYDGEIGKIIVSFLNDSKLQGLSEDTLSSKRLYLYRLLDYLNTKKISSISDLDKYYILYFINELGFYSKATIHCMLSSLRGFLKYLSDNHYTYIDFSYLVPKSSYKKEAHLPTTYTKTD